MAVGDRDGSQARGGAFAEKALAYATCVLVVVYATPLVLITYSFFATNQFDQTDAMLIYFIGFTQAGDESLGLMHRVLLPIIGGFAPLAFRDESNARLSMALMTGLILAIALSLFLNGVFNASPIKDNLYRHSLFELAEGADPTDEKVQKTAFKAGMALINAFLSRTQEAMAMYLMLLFGIKLEKATRP